MQSYSGSFQENKMADETKDAVPEPQAAPEPTGAPAPEAAAPQITESPQDNGGDQESNFENEFKWTPQEIAAAEAELKLVTPEDWLALNKVLDAVDDNLPEAGAVLFCKVISPKGTIFTSTVRSQSPIRVWDMMVAGLKHADVAYGIKPERATVPPHHPSSPYMAPPAQAAPPSTPGAPGAPGGAQPPAPAGTGKVDENGYPILEERTLVLERIKFSPSDGFEFYVATMRYPLTDRRGPSVVLGVFDAALGWNETHFPNFVEYTKAQWAIELYADIIKIQKGVKDDGSPRTYWNVVRIHK